jgi:hypothetical protein
MSAGGSSASTARRLLLGASFAYLTTSLAGIRLSLRDDLPALPLVVANLLLPGVMVVAGLRHLVRTGPRPLVTSDPEGRHRGRP